MNNNVQFYPSKIRYVPNFKLSKVISNLTRDGYEEMVINGGFRNIREKRNHKKFGDIISAYRISNADGYDNTDPLSEFDRDVLSVCGTEKMAGNDFITPAIINRALTGKIGEGADAKIHKNQRDAIMFSVQKLMSTLIWIDDSDANEKLDYPDSSATKKCSAILPAYFVDRTINGQDATVIYFDRQSPIFDIAKNRKQFITFDATLLDVTNQNNTPTIIAAKNYVMVRIAEIKAHKQLQRIITFDDIFKKCRIDNASRKAKSDARNSILKFFEHLKSKSEIKSFEITKKRNNFHSVNFQF